MKMRAGVIPYFRNGGDIEMYFMTPSDPKYGGDRPSIAKGEIDPGENAKQAAVREGAEELGLRKDNMISGTFKFGWAGKIAGLNETYDMEVYVVEVKDKTAFDIPHYETGSTHWLTLSEFIKIGRKTQIQIVAACYDKMI